MMSRFEVELTQKKVEVSTLQDTIATLEYDTEKLKNTVNKSNKLVETLTVENAKLKEQLAQ